MENAFGGETRGYFLPSFYLYSAQMENRWMKSIDDYSGFFPFGWLRGFRGDNWQIFWNKGTGDLFLKATLENTLIKVGEASDWMEAKKKADFLMENPDSVAMEFADH